MAAWECLCLLSQEHLIRSVSLDIFKLYNLSILCGALSSDSSLPTKCPIDDDVAAPSPQTKGGALEPPTPGHHHPRRSPPSPPAGGVEPPPPPSTTSTTHRRRRHSPTSSPAITAPSSPAGGEDTDVMVALSNEHSTTLSAFNFAFRVISLLVGAGLFVLVMCVLHRRGVCCHLKLPCCEFTLTEQSADGQLPRSVSLNIPPRLNAMPIASAPPVMPFPLSNTTGGAPWAEDGRGDVPPGLNSMPIASAPPVMPFPLSNTTGGAPWAEDGRGDVPRAQHTREWEAATLPVVPPPQSRLTEMEADAANTSGAAAVTQTEAVEPRDTSGGVLATVTGGSSRAAAVASMRASGAHEASVQIKEKASASALATDQEKDKIERKIKKKGKKNPSKKGKEIESSSSTEDMEEALLRRSARNHKNLVIRYGINDFMAVRRVCFKRRKKR